MTRNGMLLVILLLVACAARPTLEPRPGGNPEQIDLSGTWALRAGGEMPVDNEQTIRIPRRSQKDDAEMRQPVRSTRARGSSVHLFLESGKTLKVSQTDYGLFFSFDRAVVEAPEDVLDGAVKMAKHKPDFIAMVQREQHVAGTSMARCSSAISRSARATRPGFRNVRSSRRAECRCG